METILCILNQCSLPISQLSSAERLSASDLFIVERLETAQQMASSIASSILLEVGSSTTASDDPSLHGEMVQDILEYIHGNGKITYADLSARLLDDLSARFNFNTMSTKDTWEYAKANHTHRGQYSDTRVFPTNPAKTSDNQLWLGNFVVWQLSSGVYTSSEISVYSPVLKQAVYTLPDVGEVRFMGWPMAPTSEDSSSPIRISAYQEDVTLLKTSTDDGWWTYCNGAAVDCEASQFQDACKFFTGNPNAVQFKLPTLSNFIVLNPGIEQISPFQHIEYENGLQPHAHELVQPSSSETFELSTKVEIKTTNKTSGSGQIKRHVHSGKGTPLNDYYLSALTCTISPGTIMSCNGGSTTLAEHDIETKPKSNQLFSLVYLGRF